MHRVHERRARTAVHGVLQQIDWHNSTAAPMSNRDAAATVALLATIASGRTLRCSFWEKRWPPYGDPFLPGQGQAVASELAGRHDQRKKVVKGPIVGNRRE